MKNGYNKGDTAHFSGTHKYNGEHLETGKIVQIKVPSESTIFIKACHTASSSIGSFTYDGVVEIQGAKYLITYVPPKDLFSSIEAWEKYDHMQKSLKEAGLL